MIYKNLTKNKEKILSAIIDVVVIFVGNVLAVLYIRGVVVLLFGGILNG